MLRSNPFTKVKVENSSIVLSIIAAPDRLVTMLFDPQTQDRALLCILIGFTAVWTLYASISHASVDVHSDVAELVGAWRAPYLGFHHPPLAYWIVGAWFTLFPREDWASFLLVRSVVGLSLWISWKIFGDWLDDIKRIAALAMLTLVPLLTFHALKFNCNVAMIPVWAATIWFFLRLRPSRAALTDIIFPETVNRRVIAVALWAPLLLPALANLVEPTRLTSLWTIPDWTLFPVVLLSSPLVLVSRRAATRILAFALAVPFGAILAAPAVAIITHLNMHPQEQAHFEQVARAVDEFWHNSTDKPLIMWAASKQWLLG